MLTSKCIPLPSQRPVLGVEWELNEPLNEKGDLRLHTHKHTCEECVQVKQSITLSPNFPFLYSDPGKKPISRPLKQSISLFKWLSEFPPPTWNNIWYNVNLFLVPLQSLDGDHGESGTNSDLGEKKKNGNSSGAIEMERTVSSSHPALTATRVQWPCSDASICYLLIYLFTRDGWQ